MTAAMVTSPASLDSRECSAFGEASSLQCEPLTIKASAGYTIHNPIVIANDSDFANQAAFEGWPGDGTEEEPYVIENLNITTDMICISISDTRAFFVISGCFLASISVDHYNGIQLENVTNGLVENLRIQSKSVGVYFEESSNSMARANKIELSRLDGVNIWKSSNITARDNTVIFSGDDGVGSVDSQELKIINNTIVNPASSGIVAGSSPQAIIVSNRVYDTGEDCIELGGSDDALIEDNVLSNGWYGIDLSHSTDLVISGNSISNTRRAGMSFYFSPRCDVVDNSFEDCEGLSIRLAHSSDVSNLRFGSFYGNTIDGKPIALIQDQSYTTLGEDLGEAIVIDSNDIMIQGLRGSGVTGAFADRLVIADCVLNNGGIVIYHSDNTIITENSLNNSGIYARSADDALIAGNMLNGAWWGIRFTYSHRVLIRNNMITNSVVGISTESASTLTIIANTIDSSTYYGVDLDYTAICVLTSNIVTDSGDYGIRFSHADQNEVSLNRFEVAGISLALVESSSGNQWDNGTHGNYWGDYSGTDSNSDGIGDTPYAIDTGNEDSYPLIDSEIIDWFRNGLDVEGPSITISFQPAVPQILDSVTVSAEVTDSSSITQAVLLYSVDGENTWTNSLMVYDGVKWTTTISAQPDGAVVSFCVLAWDAWGNLGESTTASYTIGLATTTSDDTSTIRPPPDFPFGDTMILVVVGGGAAAMVIAALVVKRRS